MKRLQSMQFRRNSSVSWDFRFSRASLEILVSSLKLFFFTYLSHQINVRLICIPGHEKKIYRSRHVQNMKINHKLLRDDEDVKGHTHTLKVIWHRIVSATLLMTRSSSTCAEQIHPNLWLLDEEPDQDPAARIDRLIRHGTQSKSSQLDFDLDTREQ